MEKDLSVEIMAEMCKAIHHLSEGKWRPSHGLGGAFYKEAEKNGAGHVLLSIIGSWGDTMPDEDMLYYIKDYNKAP